MTFTDKLRSLFDGFLKTIGRSLLKVGIKANFITVLGVIGNCIAAYFISRGDLRWGGVILLLTGPLDAIDGTVARLQGNSKPFGALLDSVCDRISEAAIMLGFLIYFLARNDATGCVLVFFSLVGSLLVSYVRARAQSLGVDPKIGIMTRVERFIVVVLCLLFSQPEIGLWIIALLTTVTIIQRTWYAWKELH